METEKITVRFGIDLEPRGRRLIDLLGRTKAQDFTWFGCCYVQSGEGEHKEALRVASVEIKNLTRKMTRKMMIELIEELGGFLSAQDRRKWKKSELACYVHNALIDAWFPPRFINEKVEARS